MQSLEELEQCLAAAQMGILPLPLRKPLLKPQVPAPDMMARHPIAQAAAHFRIAEFSEVVEDVLVVFPSPGMRTVHKSPYLKTPLVAR